jgi:hypothetical protein
MRAALRFLARGLVGAIVAGIAIARTADAQVLPTWTVQREMTIDSLTDGRIIVDSAGRIYAEQIVAHNVRVYSPKGVLLRTLDGYYNRPPEWKVGVSGMGLVGDSLWVETGNRVRPHSRSSMPRRTQTGVQRRGTTGKSPAG